MENTTASLFERASRAKLRFDTPRGYLTVEDLWDLPLTARSGVSLDDIAKHLNREVKASAEESFVVKANKTNATLQLCFDAVKHVIEVKLAEAEEARASADKAERKQKLLGLIAQKQDEKLSSSSEEELKEMVAAL